LFTGIKRSSSQGLLAAQDAVSNEIRLKPAPSRRVADVFVLSLLAIERANG